MMRAALPQNEQERLSALYEYNILDTLPEKDFDDITKLASEICNTPISLITLIEGERQWFKSAHGMEGTETSRDFAFCAHAILEPEKIMVVPNANNDARFSDNPFVTGDPHVGFYAGMPLVTDLGYPLGTLCIIDNKPKDITEKQKQALRALANQVVKLLELHRKNEELQRSRLTLQNINRELEQFATVVSNDIKSPLNNIINLAGVVLNKYGSLMDADGQQMLATIKYSSNNLKKVVEDIQQHTASISAIEDVKKHTQLTKIVDQVKTSLNVADNVKLSCAYSSNDIYVYEQMLTTILHHLIENAIIHNQNLVKNIDVELSSDKKHYKFLVKDNGVGISFAQLRKIFELFNTGAQADDKELTSGFGLATVKALVEKLGGKIDVMSEEGVGSTFTFTIRK